MVASNRTVALAAVQCIFRNKGPRHVAMDQLDQQVAQPPLLPPPGADSPPTAPRARPVHDLPEHHR